MSNKKPLTIRIREETKESLEDEAAEYGVSVSEYVRELIDKGREYDDLEVRLESREERIETLEAQIAETRNIESKIDDLRDLPDIVRNQESYTERRQRMLDQASVVQRMKWKVTGVPVNETEDEQ
jgi:antitoxin component of RelBE/YafQ-DinJ toxin-antitoxin module